MAGTIVFILPGSGGTQTAPPTYQRYTTDRKKVRFNFAGDAAYPTGGYAITPANLGFANNIDFLDITGEVNAGSTANVYFVWNRATQKMQAVVPSTGAEVGNGVDVHTSNVDCAAEGV